MQNGEKTTRVNRYIVTIIYFHHLQNLYFDLTDQELEITDIS